MNRIAVLLLSLTLIPQVLAAETLAAIDADTNLGLPLYSATYKASFNGMPVVATRSLSFANDSYQLATTAKNFLGGINEAETFKLKDGQIVVDNYHHQRSLLGSKRKEDFKTDHQSGIAIYTRKKKTRNITLQSDYLGPMSYQVQIRRDLLADIKNLSYRVIHRGKVKEYRFERDGEETLSTPLGNINCVRLKRIREDDERETLFWMAPGMNYLLIKLRQKEDNEVYELAIESIGSTQ